MTVNFRGPDGNGRVSQVDLLVFGGINFKNQESRETFHLKIDLDAELFTMTHLPNARLPHSDRFIDNQTIYVNSDMNIVSVVGKHSL